MVNTGMNEDYQVVVGGAGPMCMAHRSSMRSMLEIRGRDMLGPPNNSFEANLHNMSRHELIRTTIDIENACASYGGTIRNMDAEINEQRDTIRMQTEEIRIRM